MPASKRINSDSAKPKSSRKRRKASINFNPKSRAKKKVLSNQNREDDSENDFIEYEDKVKDKATRNEMNESELSSNEGTSGINNRTNILGTGIQRTLSRRKTPATSESNTLSTISSTRSDRSSQFTGISPRVQENNLENEDGFQVLTDRNFIQQQVQLLSTAFTLERDCPGLAGKQDRRQKSIPHDIIHEALRKLHHKMDDEIQKHLNRQCQREVLSELLEMEKDTTVHKDEDEEREKHVTETMSVSEILENCPAELENNGDTDPNVLRKYTNSIAEVRTLNDEIKKVRQQIASYESNNLMVSEVESLARERPGKSLPKEIERTKKLVSQVTRVLRGNTNSA